MDKYINASRLNYVQDGDDDQLLFTSCTPLTVALMCLLLIYYTIMPYEGDPLSSLPLPPGTMGWPLIGETLALVTQGIEFYRRRRTQFGCVYKTHLLGCPTVRVMGASRVREVLRSQNVTSHWPTSAKSILGDGAISMVTGDMHRLRKRTLIKAFSQDAMRRFAPHIQHVVTDHLTSWLSQHSVLTYPACRKIMFDISTKVLLGLEISHEQSDEMLKTFEVFSRNLFSLPIAIPGMGLHKGLKARQKLIQQLSECLDHQGANRGILSDLDTSNCNILDSALELLFAGHETSSSAACSAVKAILEHPSTAVRLKQEIDSHVTQQEVTYDVIHHMTYLDNFVKEVLRVDPPIGGGFRKVTKTFELDGYQIPKGWTLIYAIRDTHEVDDGCDFNPDRWSNSSPIHTTTSSSHPEHKAASSDTTRSSHQFLSFGYGSRTCPGRAFAKLSLKVFLIQLLKHCDIQSNGEISSYKYFPVPYPTNGLPILVQPSKR